VLYTERFGLYLDLI